MVVDQEVYTQKMLDLLSSTDYIQLKKDPTLRIATQLKNHFYQHWINVIAYHLK